MENQFGTLLYPVNVKPSWSLEPTNATRNILADLNYEDWLISIFSAHYSHFSKIYSNSNHPL